MVAQLCISQDRIPSTIEQAFDRITASGTQPKLSFEELEDALVNLSVNETFLLVDALDESKAPIEVVHVLERSRRRTTTIHTLVASRDERDIRELLMLATTSRVQLEDYRDDLSWDIRYYIDDRLQRDQKLQWLMSSVEYQIADKLNKGAAGM